jgi:glycosyltransferase involved in cell wall biosynthesis
MALRVLHVTPYFAPAFGYGGPPRSVLGLCRGLGRAGVEVRVVTTTADGRRELSASPPEGDRYEGVAVHYLPRAFPRRLFGARGLGSALDRAVAGADVVHVHGLWTIPGWAASRRARVAGLPVVISPRGMLDPGSLARRGWRKRVAYALIERGNLRRASLVHATSESEARAIRHRLPGTPVVTIPNGVEAVGCPPEAAGRARQRLGIPAGAPILTFLGRIHPIKRLDVLAVAFDHVRGRRPDAHLVIAGPEEGNERRRLEPFFRAAGRAVHWAGVLGDGEKWALLADSSLLVLCSDSESFGLSVVEAMAAGLPVIATRSCPWAEIETAGAGLWVDQEPGAVAEAALAVLRDPAKAREMGARGRALARDRYSWEAAAGAMAESYRRLAGRSEPPLIVTPGLGGADGISVMSRLFARTLAPARVLSLADDEEARPPQGVGLIGARASRLRYVWQGMRRAWNGRRSVVCLHLRLGFLARLLAWRGGQLTMVLVGIEAWRPLRGSERRALEQADRILAISAHTLQRFRAANPACAGLEVSVCHLGLGEAAATAPARDEASPFALIVGRMASDERYKGHDLLLEVWPRVLAQCPEARLVMAGDGDDRARLERKAAEVGQAVRFTGRVREEELAALYRDCAFFVMPSREEGFGLVFLEAMRAGKACVGAVGAPSELIEDGVTGLVVDPEDGEQVVKAAVKLFQDPVLAGSLGEAGRERWRREFTEAAFARRLQGLLAR